MVSQYLPNPCSVSIRITINFISGGDLNSLPPVNQGDTIPDFCENDRCDWETFHNDTTNGGPHKSGSYFEYDESENTIKAHKEIKMMIAKVLLTITSGST